MPDAEPTFPDPQLLDLPSGKLEIFTATPAQPSEESATPVIAAAHPASALSGGAATLLSGIAQRQAICLNPRGLGGSDPVSEGDAHSFETMVDDLEAARLALGLDPWIFWGMSGGGWLALTYAHRHPEGLRGIIVESACPCFRERLADPRCALSPFFSVWRPTLTEKGWLVEGSHEEPSDASDATWEEIEGLGQVFRSADGAALFVSPAILDDAMAEAIPLLWTFDAREWLPTLDLPALVIAGGQDPVAPAHHVRAVHEGLLGSRYVEIEGGGHVPSSNGDPLAQVAVREFLRTVV